MSSSIDLSWPELVRHRPSMYIGTTDDRGLMTLFHEAFDFSAQEFRSGLSTRISVTFHADQALSIEDDGTGPGLSPPVPPDTLTEFERLLTDIRWLRGRTGRYCGAIAPQPAVINALSASVTVESRRAGQRGLIRYERGRCVEPLHLTTTEEDDGYRLRYRFDKWIFPSARYDSAQIRQWLWEQSALHPGLLIVYRDESTGTIDRFRTPEGMGALLREECRGKSAIWPEALRIEMRQGPFRYDLAVDCLPRGGLSVCSFANGSPTREGGAHVVATRDALAVALRRFVKGLGAEQVRWSREKLLWGVVMAIAVDLPDPEFVGPTRQNLAHHEIEAAIYAFVCESVTMFLQRKPEHVKRWREWISTRAI